MRAVILASLLVVTSCNIRAMDGNRMPLLGMTPKEFIITGVVAGCAIQLVDYVRREGRYKEIGKFAAHYPGYSIAALSAFIGFGFLYGQPIASFFRGRLNNSKPQ